MPYYYVVNCCKPQCSLFSGLSTEVECVVPLAPFSCYTESDDEPSQSKMNHIKTTVCLLFIVYKN